MSRWLPKHAFVGEGDTCTWQFGPDHCGELRTDPIHESIFADLVGAREIPGSKSNSGPIVDQPPPEQNESRPIWELVIEDMQERDRVGRERYGTPLQAHNGRLALVDAYQESLDQVVYLRQEIAEREDLLAFLESAWGLIANAGGGNWETQTRDWQESAARWRERYHQFLDPIGATE